MRKKISESVELKTFLGMLALLVVCCALIYAMVMVFLPRSYQTEIEGQVSSDFSSLVALLEERGWQSAEQDVLEFSVRNNASVQIVDEAGVEAYSVNYADTESVSSPGQTMSMSAQFSEGGRACRPREARKRRCRCQSNLPLLLLEWLRLSAYAGRWLAGSLPFEAGGGLQRVCRIRRTAVHDAPLVRAAHRKARGNCPLLKNAPSQESE